jgi:hypothetical protein
VLPRLLLVLLDERNCQGNELGVLYGCPREKRLALSTCERPEALGESDHTACHQASIGINVYLHRNETFPLNLKTLSEPYDMPVAADKLTSSLDAPRCLTATVTKLDRVCRGRLAFSRRRGSS